LAQIVDQAVACRQAFCCREIARPVCGETRPKLAGGDVHAQAAEHGERRQPKVEVARIHALDCSPACASRCVRPVQRCATLLLLTAMPIALRLPTSTHRLCARVTPVYSRLRCSMM